MSKIVFNIVGDSLTPILEINEETTSANVGLALIAIASGKFNEQMIDYLYQFTQNPECPPEYITVFRKVIEKLDNVKVFEKVIREDIPKEIDL